MQHASPIPDNRDLSPSERHLLRWLLEHGNRAAAAFLDQVDGVRVMSRCGCGCASIDFVAERSQGIDILSDYLYDDEQGNPFGVFAFACGDRLAGLEVWSLDGARTPDRIPTTDVLHRVWRWRDKAIP